MKILSCAKITFFVSNNKILGIGYASDEFQQQCCGGFGGPHDYYDSFWYKTNTLRGTRSFVPKSCCKQSQYARAWNIKPVDAMCTTYMYYSHAFNSSVNIEAIFNFLKICQVFLTYCFF